MLSKNSKMLKNEKISQNLYHIRKESIPLQLGQENEIMKTNATQI